MKDNEQDYGFEQENVYDQDPEFEQEFLYESEEESEPGYGYETEYDQEYNQEYNQEYDQEYDQEYEYVPDPVYQYEQDIDEEDGGNYWDDEVPVTDYDEDDRQGIVFTPWVITGAVVIVLLAILIGVSLWQQKEPEAVDDERYQEILASLEQSTDSEQATTPVSTESQESSESASESTESLEGSQESTETPEVTPAPSDQPTPTPPSTVSQNSTTGLVSGDVSMHFDEVNDVVTALTRTNLRSEPSTQNAGNVVVQLSNGQNVTRIGVNAETGWSKLEYNGQVVYAATQYLIVQ